MNAITILVNDRDIQLVKRTVAQDLLPAELDLFIHMCRRWRLDPLRRQIYAHVYVRNKKESENGKDVWVKVRNVVYVTGIDGYRTIADRTGNYRPGQRSVEHGSQDADTNPQGIISATASVWKHVHGEWHEFSETVYWDEFAPIKDEWDGKGDNRKRTGKRILDTSGQWGKMGRVMLQKCAEAQALRRGWPDEYADLYVAEEMEQAKVIDITPSEQAERADAEEKLELIGGKDALTVDWCDGGKLARVPFAKFPDAVLEYANRKDVSEMELRVFWDRNLPARGEFKAKAGHDYLELQKAVEKIGNAKAEAEATQVAAE